MDKNILKKFAIESRKLLMDQTKKKIDRLFLNEEFEVINNGDLVILRGLHHSFTYTQNEYKNRLKLLERIKEITEERVVEEAAYTWFNRIIALRYMEIHDYLPLTSDNQSLGIRVLSDKDNTPNPEIMKLSNLRSPELDIGFDYEKYSTINLEEEKYKYIMLLLVKKLGRVIPQVFDGVTDYIDILIPDGLLLSAGIIKKLLTDVPEENFSEVEIIGWLYQYYNQTEKDRVISAKKVYKKHEIAYATQLFTPDWIVKYMVENSLGRYWIEHRGDTRLIDNWKYYIKDANIELKETIDPKDIKCIDPCSGSGHILVYLFEVLYQIYLSYGYSKAIIPESILENNLYGLEIDDRAFQLSVLSVLLKAREYDRDIFNKKVTKGLNIISISETNTMDRRTLDVIKKDGDDIENYTYNEALNYIYDNMKDAKEIGSLLIIEDKNYSDIQKTIEEKLNGQQSVFDMDKLNEIKNKFLPVLKSALLIANKYDIVVTNPPYMNSSLMPPKLKEYINEKYNEYKSDTFSAFIINNQRINKKGGYLGFMTPYVWMFIQTYEKLRQFIIRNMVISSLIQFEYSALQEATVPICSFVIYNSSNCQKDGKYIRLTDYVGGMKKQEEMYLKAISGVNNDLYLADLSSFKLIPGSPMLYWLPKNGIDNFKYKDINKYINPRIGLVTGDTSRFLRLWYEPNIYNVYFGCKSNADSIRSKIKWFPYQKGGAYRKWYGNNEYIVNWYDDGYEMKNDNYDKITNRVRSHNYNGEYAFKKAITWTKISSSNYAFRYVNEGYMFDDAGPICSCRDKFEEYFLGLFNSKIGTYYLSMLNPTLNLTPGNLLALPFNHESISFNSTIKSVVLKLIEVSKEDWNSFETSWDFTNHPLLEYKKRNGFDNDIRSFKIKDSFDSWKRNCESKFNCLKQNEEELNRLFIDIYGLRDVLTPEVADNDITIRKADREREVKSLISYAVGCMLGRYSLDKEGLIYAGGKFSDVYQAVSSPIAGRAVSGGHIILDNRTSIFLKDGEDAIELSFTPDMDNVIPIVDNAFFSDDIVTRFVEFIRVAFGEEYLAENLNYIAETLGRKGTETSQETIRRYFVNDFYKDHCKIYQKRPIYWLFDSGKNNGFKCLIYMHRYDDATVSNIRTNYLLKVQETYENLLKDIEERLEKEESGAEIRKLEKQKQDLSSKLQEIIDYDEEIKHLADQRIKIDLDDGVKVNYAKFDKVLAKIK